MADENRELLEAMEELRKAMGGGAMTAEELAAAQKQATTGMKAFGDASKKAALNMAKGIGSFAKQVGEGDTSLKSLNKVVDVATDALGGMAKAIPFAGEAINAAVKATGEASKFVLNQLDATAKVFNDFSKVGALGSKGMSGVFEQFNRSGMSLQGFNKAIQDNAQALARFKGLAADGADDFSKIVGSIVDSGAGMELRRIGLSADQIGESTAAFLTQQTRLGRSQTMTQQQLNAGTVEYVKELDQLSKVTGLSREAIQKQQDAALSESKFRANYELLMSQGKEKEAKALMTLQSRMQSFGGELGQGVRDLSSGITNTDAAIKMVNSTGGAALDIINRLKSGQIDQDQAQQELADAYARNKDAQLQIASQVGNTIGVYTDTAQSMDFINAAQQGQWEKSKKVQTEQTKGGDKLTDATVAAQQNLEMMNRQMARLGFTLMPSAAKAVEAFTKTLSEFVGWVGKELGIEMPGAKGGPGGGGVVAGAKAGAAKGAAMGSVVPVVGTAAGAVVGGIAGGIKGFFSGGSSGGKTPNVDPYDYISFTGGTGDKEHFNQLLPAVKDSFLLMAQEYNNLTGKKLQINSAFRSPEEQANVNSGGNPKAAPGMSLHQQGRALDIQSDQVAALASQGLLGKYGFNQLAGDPPHISMANGGVLSGPSSGYRPNLTMHGSEAIVPLPDGRSIPVQGAADSSIMQAQLAKLEELVGVMKQQVSISNKLLSYSS